MSEIESTPHIKKWYFYTLTLLGADHKGLLHSVKRWRAEWSKLRKRIVRDLGKIRFVRVFEMHKSGTMHIHMLCDKTYTDTINIKAVGKSKSRTESVKLRKHLNDLGLGYIHDIKPIVTTEIKENGIARNVSAYIVKYMTKNSMQFAREILREDSGKIRLIQTSHKWFNDDRKEPELDWTKEPIFLTEYMALDASKTVTDITVKQGITIDDFYEEDYYPNRISDLVQRADNQINGLTPIPFIVAEVTNQSEPV